MLTRLGVWSASPFAFSIVLIYTIGWIFAEPDTFDWHAVATLATWTMTLFIQRAEHRDTQAIHGKLDELIRAQTNAKNELTKLDQQEPEEIEQHRVQAEKNADP
jgi:low affinity Fe/Cu permease